MRPPSPRRRGPLTLSALILSAASISGCAGMPPIVTTLAALDCAREIPADHRQPVRGVPLPRLDAGKGEIASALDGQTGRLDAANGHTADVVKIVDACADRQQRVLKALLPQHPAWQVWRR